jgi:hypothetical protein
MSSTRKAKDDSEFYPNRYASSPEYERGISATLTAKRCSILDNSKDRLLLWFVQWLSWQPGALENLAHYVEKRCPLGYSTKDLIKLCVDPESGHSGKLHGEWGNVNAAREYRAAYMKDAGPVFNTALGQKVCEVLDYTSFSRGLTLMEGEARTGKSFAARAWCEQRAGGARFVEVPPGNDDSGFFRALARGLGIGNFLQYKAREIRERVEAVLLSHDLILVLDEAQRLWPQRNLRYGYPHRIVWVMAMANAGVPIAMVSTPQFSQVQKAVEKSGWNAAQFTGRIKHYEPLPHDLSKEDLMAVAKTVLPEADTKVLRALAIYARSSARYLAAIDSISIRARYIAMKAERSAATTDDVRKAMQESVIPSDTRLVSNLGRARGKDLQPADDPQAMPGNRIADSVQPRCGMDAMGRPEPLPV